MKWNVRYLEEAYCDLKNLDNSIMYFSKDHRIDLTKKHIEK